ncbi:MAG: hypothetical protein ACYSU7_08490, partial [Planctomycetota bacterium]|jgi:hypothetical protein
MLAMSVMHQRSALLSRQFMTGPGAQKHAAEFRGSSARSPILDGSEPPPPSSVTIECRVVRVEDDLLVEALAEVDGDISTGPGPHDRELTLRLGLRFEDGIAWPDGARVLRWRSPDEQRVYLVIAHRE